MPEPSSNVRTGRRRPATSRWRTPPAQPTGNSATTGIVYRPRGPTHTPLYPVVQHHLETFLATAEDDEPTGWGVPSWVERDFRAYLRCGILAHGFARAHCDACGHERLVAFRCKGAARAPAATRCAWPRSPSISPTTYSPGCRSGSGSSRSQRGFGRTFEAIHASPAASFTSSYGPFGRPCTNASPGASFEFGAGDSPRGRLLPTSVMP